MTDCIALICATAIQFSLASHHGLERDDTTGGGSWCQTNPGLLVERNKLILGVYRNSECRTTLMAGWRESLYRRGWFDLGAFGALASGYRIPLVGALDLRIARHFDVYAAPMWDDKEHLPDSYLVGFTIRFETR